MRFASIARAFVILGLFMFSTRAIADAPLQDPAARQIQLFTDTLLESMKQAKQLGISGRYSKLKPVIAQTFDLPAMTQLAVGPAWSSVPASQQKSLIQAFEKLTVANYARNFDDYSGERFVIDPAVLVRGNDRLVQTRLEVPKGDPVPFTYRMHQSDGTWKVIDIFLNGYVSELATRRSDFSTTMAASGPAALVKQIDTLSDKLLAGG
jgi:phospholipid transport system substrate-binding protein